MSWHFSKPYSIALIIVSSGISSPPASIIITLSFVAQTVNWRILSSLSFNVGFKTKFPSINPTWTAPTGVVNGMLDRHNAIDAALIARISGKLSCSTETTVQTTWTSFLYPFGNNGLRGLSTALPKRIAFSEGLPSLLMNPPGILPTEYNLSSYSTLSGKKSIPSLGFSEALTFVNITVSP